MKDVLSHSQTIARYFIVPVVVDSIAEAIVDKCMSVLWKKYQEEVGGNAYRMLLQSGKRTIFFWSQGRNLRSQ